MKWSRELRIARRSMRTALRAATAMAVARASVPATPARIQPLESTRPALVAMTGFGSNPGRLSMLVHLPDDDPAPCRPLVVLLHGCGQAAATFARSSGWLALSDQLGIPLVLPEQADENNQGRCFNWFRPDHTGRGRGEALSIRQMVATAVERFGSDPSRVFIAGLSAGGAMAAALLAAYPDVFAAGAVVAGLPVGAAASVPEALRRMAEAGPDRSPLEWAAQVRQAAPPQYRGPWPRLSVWHGAADRVVDPANARLIAAQWASVHGIDQASKESVDLSGMRRDRWGAAGRPLVELCSVPDLAHDWPPGSARNMAEFWQIAGD